MKKKNKRCLECKHCSKNRLKKWLPNGFYCPELKKRIKFTIKHNCMSFVKKPKETKMKKKKEILKSCNKCDNYKDGDYGADCKVILKSEKHPEYGHEVGKRLEFTVANKNFKCKHWKKRVSLLNKTKKWATKNNLANKIKEKIKNVKNKITSSYAFDPNILSGIVMTLVFVVIFSSIVKTHRKHCPKHSKKENVITTPIKKKEKTINIVDKKTPEGTIKSFKIDSLTVNGEAITVNIASEIVVPVNEKEEIQKTVNITEVLSYCESCGGLLKNRRK